MNADRSISSQFSQRPVLTSAAAPLSLDGLHSPRGGEAHRDRGDAAQVRAAPVPPLVSFVPDPPPAARRRGGWGPRTVLAAADLLVVAAGLCIAHAAWRRPLGASGGVAAANHLHVAALSLPLWLLVLAKYRLFSARHIRRVGQELNRLIHASAAGTAVTGLVALALGVPIARGWLALGFVAVTTGLVIERAVARAIFDRLRGSRRLTRRIIVLGADAAAMSLAATLARSPRLGYEVVGFVDDSLPVGTIVAGNQAVLGRLADAAAVVASSGAQGAVIVPSAVDGHHVNAVARKLADSGVHVEVISPLRGIAPERMTVGAIGTQFGVVHVQPMRRAGWRAFAKRAFDVTLAVTGLMLAAPLLAAVAVLVKLDSRGPVLFRQRRLGRDGVTFELLKLRSMVVDAEAHLEDLRHLNEADGPLFKVRRDPRVTRVGRMLRSMSLDEVPQLWNVLRGEMSIVGPRPALPAEAESWRPELHQRLRVRPGITGMWQVHSRGGANFEDYVELDLYYVDNWSLPMDLQIMLRTVPSVLLERGAH